MLPHITHHGAVRGVTGSCHQLHLAKHCSVLIDCGAFQGQGATTRRGLGFSPDGVQALILTHVHLDHVGRIPELLAAGFTGPIVCSEPSARLLALVLEDAFRLGYSQVPRHIRQYLKRLAGQVQAVAYGQWWPVPGGKGTQVRLERAGHVLGSAYVECDVPTPHGVRRVVFSGDLGAGDSPLLIGPHAPERADVLVLESTYGDRVHSGRGNRQQQLESLVERALQNDGTVLIPAFSLGRVQDLLFDLARILEHKALKEGADANGAGVWHSLPIILDSPLATRITQAYNSLRSFWSQSAQRHGALMFPQLITIDSHANHQKVVNYLASTLRPAIVIAGNGMCSGGRVMNYLKRMVGAPQHCVVFTGYQAPGTPGAALKAITPGSGEVVQLEKVGYEVRANVCTLAGYSAHADQLGLLAFTSALAPAPKHICLVHGDSQAKRALAAKLKGLMCPSTKVWIP